MKILFYSNQCEYSKKFLAYLQKHNIESLFKLFNIDEVNPPDEIDIVPTVIDSELNQPLKGKKAFEYLINLKYFNNPTNNVELVKELPKNPDIPIDEIANENVTSNLEIESDKTDNKSVKFHEEHKTEDVNKSTQQMVNMRTSQDKRFVLLMKMKK
jgi:hypothetical protein